MTKRVRNSARLTITELGGAVCRPMAVRSSDSTTTMRVKLVTITEDGGRQREQGDEPDELDRPLGERRVVAEIDGDVLAEGQASGRAIAQYEGEKSEDAGAARADSALIRPCAGVSEDSRRCARAPPARLSVPVGGCS